MIKLARWGRFIAWHVLLTTAVLSQWRAWRSQAMLDEAVGKMILGQ